MKDNWVTENEGEIGEDYEEDSDKDEKSSEDQSSTYSDSLKQTITVECKTCEMVEYLEEIESNISFKIEYFSKQVNTTANSEFKTSNNQGDLERKLNSPRPTDATLKTNPFVIGRFFVCLYSKIKMIRGLSKITEGF